MSPFALSILGLESMNRRRPDERAEDAAAVRNITDRRATRSSRRATSNYNSFQTVCSPSYDDAPAYALATKHRLAQSQAEREDVLPKYECTIQREARLLLQLESINPLHGVMESDWREVYVILSGTLFSFYRLKNGGPGKLLKSYTLQHAEIGLASDTEHTILVPQTRLAHLIPNAARRKAWQKDATLFQSVRQTILRLRAETDQILLAGASEELMHELVHAISAGIDISQPLDERSIPRQCTVPRRRRRQRPTLTGDLSDPAFLAEQERILQDMYPAFAEPPVSSPVRALLERTTTTATEDIPAETAQNRAREEDDLDFAVMREDFAAPNTPAPSQSPTSSMRPAFHRHHTASSVTSALSADMIYSTSPDNFTAAGKWQPPHPRTPAQIQRYARRCMPVLLVDAVRASDILICNGQRVKINWRMELLEQWELQPPRYKAHDFPSASPHNATGLARSRSTASTAPSATNTTPQSSTSVVGTGAEQIEPNDSSGLTSLDLAKAASGGESNKHSPTQASAPQRSQSFERKTQELQQQRALDGEENQVMVSCF